MCKRLSLCLRFRRFLNGFDGSLRDLSGFRGRLRHLRRVVLFPDRNGDKDERNRRDEHRPFNYPDAGAGARENHSDRVDEQMHENRKRVEQEFFIVLCREPNEHGERDMHRHRGHALQRADQIDIPRQVDHRLRRVQVAKGRAEPRVELHRENQVDHHRRAKQDDDLHAAVTRAIHQRVCVVAALFAQHGFECEIAPRLLKQARHEPANDRQQPNVADNLCPERGPHQEIVHDLLQHEREKHKRRRANPEWQVFCAFFAEDDVQRHHDRKADEPGERHRNHAQVRNLCVHSCFVPPNIFSLLCLAVGLHAPATALAFGAGQ